MTSLPMQKNIWLPALIIVSLLGFIAGCNQVQSLTDPNQSVVSADKREPDLEDPEVISMSYLNYLWVGSNHDDWDVLTAVIDPVEGGRVSGTPASWPAEYVFGAYFPPGCIDSTEPFTVSISIPRLVPGDIHAPVFLLEPHGIQFAKEVTVQFCYPYWEEQYSSYAKFSFWPAEEAVTGGPVVDPVPVYRVSDYEVLFPEERNTHLAHTFKTTHFSRWGMSHGDGGNTDLTYDPRRDHRWINR